MHRIAGALRPAARAQARSRRTPVRRIRWARGGARARHGCAAALSEQGRLALRGRLRSQGASPAHPLRHVRARHASRHRFERMPDREPGRQGDHPVRPPAYAEAAHRAVRRRCRCGLPAPCPGARRPCVGRGHGHACDAGRGISRRHGSSCAAIRRSRPSCRT